ncbi:MAG: SUMF1/EgtB/PvdO family nonheme iron enzyme [Myxococcota bacterium]
MWDPETDEEAVERTALLDSAQRLDGNWNSGASSLTQAGMLVGTPHYMAPELWYSQPASRQTDIYALGVLLYILCVGKPPYAALSPFELGVRIVEQPPSSVRTVAPSVDARLAAIIDRCLRTDPAERFPSADVLREALEGLSSGERRPPLQTDNPYRGLQAFEAEHRDLFFGRGAELRAVLERLRADPFVLVAGDSGVGKSSLCRAGVGPSVVDGAIDPERRWTYATMTPGRRPLRALVSLLVSHFDLEQDGILTVAQSRPDTLGWLLHKKLGRWNGKLLFIDQFEELVTLSDRKEAEIVGKVLAQLAAGVPGMRLLATVRGDFLTRAANIPHIGDELSRAIYLLRPLSPEGIREAIVGPAETMGVRYESSEMVGELVEAGLESSLPILQFALAELWEVRGAGSRVITCDDLRGIGGVAGALARHAQGLMASLLPKQRVAAKDLLLRLVTIDDTRARLSAEELVADHEDSRLALDALVKGRLLVVREQDSGPIYEIAHEALIREWDDLRRWLDEAAEIRALRHRLELAAAEWERLGRPRDALWTGAQLDEVAELPRHGLRPREAEFLAQGERARVRGRLVSRGLAVAIPGVLLAGYGLVRLQAQAELDARVDARVGQAEAGLGRAQASRERFLAAQAQAFEHYDKGADAPARQAWTEAKAEVEAADKQLAIAAREYERALTLDPTRGDVRARLGDALLVRAELAEHRREPSRVAELLERVALYDEDGERMARWNVPARLSVETTPAGATIELVEYRLDDRRRRVPSEPRALGTSPLSDHELPQGSYRLEVTVEGRPPVLFPVILGRGESRSLSIAVPPAEAIPPGFAYVPAGQFLVGCQDEALCDVFYNSVPLHAVQTESYFIARHEVTYGEWIEFLESVPADERADLTPKIEQGYFEVSLEPTSSEGGVGWILSFPREAGELRAFQGEPLILDARERRRSQPWAPLPVLAISFELGRAYFGWLDRTGRVPGARFCTDHEWERAGRGADGRLYPHGDHLDPHDANIDVTYGKDPMTWGPDVVGSHPESRSPFGIDGLSGNAGEWTVDALHGNVPVLRGGSFMMDAISAHLVGRQLVPPDFMHGSVGLRACASFPLSRSLREPEPPG